MLSSVEMKRQTFNIYINCATSFTGNKQMYVCTTRIYHERILIKLIATV